jgi:hypothetical protein
MCEVVLMNATAPNDASTLPKRTLLEHVILLVLFLVSLGVAGWLGLAG